MKGKGQGWAVARRWAGIAGYTLVMLLLFHKNLTVPETRGIALVGFITVMSLAVGYELSMRGRGDWALPVVLLLPAVIGGSYAFWQYLTRPVPPVGPLLAANESTPSLSVCRDNVEDDDLVIALGTSRVIATGAGPFTPLQANDCPTVKLTRRGEGLVVDGFGYDNTNSLAYSIRDTRLDLLMAPGLRARRPDPHTFVLADSFNQEVFYVRYLNPGAVRIRGRFLCGANSQVVVRDEGTWVGGLRLRGVQIGQRLTTGRLCARIGPGGPAYGIRVRSG